MTSTISVAWPPITLGEPGWRTRLECLATRSEALVGRPCSLPQSAELAVELFGLIWPALGPETVASTARASLLLGLPVVMSTAPAEQVLEIAARLDDIWQAAQADPAAGVVTVPPPMLQRVKEPQTRKRPSSEQLEDDLDLDPDAEPAGVIEVIEALVEPEPEDEEPQQHCLEALEPIEPDTDELPEAWRNCAEPMQQCLEVLEPPAPAPVRQLRPLAERLAPRPPSPAAEPERIAAPELPQHLQVIEPEPVAVPLAKPAPAPRRRAAPASPPPAGWFTATEVGELLEVEPCSVARWRKEGRLGDEGTGWQQCGRCFYFAPDAVENIDRSPIPRGFDQLVAEVLAQ